jgi:hypothetical protein
MSDQIWQLLFRQGQAAPVMPITLHDSAHILEGLQAPPTNAMLA